jgi:uncharacterized protein (TIGR02284 family)
MATTSAARYASEESIGALNDLLKGEISAVETYRQAIEKLDDQRIVQLSENLDSHSRRVSRLRSYITSLGGKAVEGSGLWGAFARTVEGGAKLFGKDAALAALEEGEDQGVADYRNALSRLDTASRQVVETELMPEQLRTHRVMSDLKKGLPPSSAGRSSGLGTTMLMMAAIGFSSLAFTGCDDERHVQLNEVTPEARTAITTLAGSGQIVEIEEKKKDDGKVCYDVVIAKNGTNSTYTVDGAGNVKR